MKWARVKEKSQETISNEKHAEQIKKNDASCFDDYPNCEALEKELEHTKNEWADHEFNYHFEEPVALNYEAFQKRYEMFCGGYLLFYDNIVRSRVVDHTLHFKWSHPEKGKGKYSVKIYISPAPQTSIKTYAKICGMNKDEYDRQKTSKDFLQGVSTRGEESVDPPPPPPPPPPTMH